MAPNVGPETVHHVSWKESNVLHELKLKLETRVEVDYASAMSESEVLLPRHKRVTSGYNSDYELNLSVDDIDAEIKRLSEETAKMERHLAVMSCHSSCESGHSLNDMDIQDRFKYVTDRDVYRDRGRRLLSQSPSTVSPDRHHSVRQPTTVRQHVNESAPASSSVHHHSGHQPTAGRQSSIVRHLADRCSSSCQHVIACIITSSSSFCTSTYYCTPARQRVFVYSVIAVFVY